jgi:hypothetical protein
MLIGANPPSLADVAALGPWHIVAVVIIMAAIINMAVVCWQFIR